MTAVAEAGRYAADISDEVQRLRSIAADAADTGAHAVKRTMKSVTRGVEQLGDFRDEAVHGVKKHPLTSVAIALGAGLVLGVAIGWIAGRPGRTEPE